MTYVKIFINETTLIIKGTFTSFYNYFKTVFKLYLIFNLVFCVFIIAIAYVFNLKSRHQLLLIVFLIIMNKHNDL